MTLVGRGRVRGGRTAHWAPPRSGRRPDHVAPRRGVPRERVLPYALGVLREGFTQPCVPPAKGGES